ncbi:MAG: GH25 family lysozyme [Alloprevotella sp.]
MNRTTFIIFLRKKALWLVAALVVIVSLLIAFLPSSDAETSRRIVRLTARSCYALPVGEHDTLFFSLRNDSTACASTQCAEVLSESIQTTGVWVSNEGHVLTSDTLVFGNTLQLTPEETRRRLETMLRHHQERIRRTDLICEELNYYALKHSEIDDGFALVMGVKDSMEQLRHELWRTDSLLRLALTQSEPASLRCLAHASFFAPAEGDSMVHTVTPLRLIDESPEHVLTLQTTDARLPHGASRFSVFRFGIYAFRARIFAFNDPGDVAALPYPFALEDSLCKESIHEGAAYVNPSGNLCGLRVKGRRVNSYTLASVLADRHLWVVWWLRNFRAFVMNLLDSEAPTERTLLSPTAESERKLYDNGDHFFGQLSAEGLRQGFGRLSRADSTVYVGQWQADTLVEGSATLPQGTYVGTFAGTALEPEGEGLLRRANGFYAGEWHTGRRHGMGLDCSHADGIRVGTWNRGSFKGERLIFTEDRIYGIDISRHQHEFTEEYRVRRRTKKRKVIRPIDWNSLRIVGIGKDKRVKGNVSYPVSFVYIKTTEGTSIKSNYYLSDLEAARKRGIAAGAYHFFSIKTGGREQAQWFLRHAALSRTVLPPVLDVEPTPKQIAAMGGRDKLFREMLAWIDVVEKTSGKKPILYLNQRFINEQLPHAPQRLRDCEVWVARYSEFKPYVRLLHWQLTPNGQVRGIHGSVDINVFNGTRSQFEDYVKGARRGR